MSTPAVSSATIFQELQGFYQNRQQDLQQLGSDLKGGNLSAAQQDFQALAVLGESGPFANSEPFGNSARAQAFNAVGEALQAGDLGRAQTAFATLTSSQHTTTPPITPATVVSLTAPSSAAGTSTSDSASSIYQQIQSYRQQRSADVAQLGKDLQAGDLTAAQQDFSTLTALGQSGPNSNGQVFQLSSRTTDLQAIGQALQSGDLTGAQTAFTALSATFGSQNPQAQNAISAYSSGVTEIVINFGSTPTSGTVPAGTVPPAHSTTPPITPIEVPPAPEPPVPLPALAGGTTSTSTSQVANPASTGTSATASTGQEEIVINLGASASSNSNNNPELIINLGQSGASSGSSTATSNGPEILVNFGAPSSTAASSQTSSSGSTSAPELIINLGQQNGSSSSSSPELTINLNGSSGAQLLIEGTQGQNGGSAAPLAINLSPKANYEIIVNLLNSSLTNSANNSGSNGLSLTA